MVGIDHPESIMSTCTYRLKELARHARVEVFGDAEIEINGVGSLRNARKGQITFLASSEYRHLLDSTQASAVIIQAADQPDHRLPTLISHSPHATFVCICELFPVAPVAAPGIHRRAVIGNNCTLGKSISIAAGAVIGDNVVIGNHSIIGANCTLEAGCVLGDSCHIIANAALAYGTKLGSNVIIHPGAVIGSDGFGFTQDNQGKWIKIPQRGCVILGDDVEIGANSTIDRGTLDDTVLESDVKIDNQVQIAHNVYIGEHTAIAGCVCIAGSTTIGKRCKIGGAVGISGHLTIADDIAIAAKSVVIKSLTRAGFHAPHNPIFINRNHTRLSDKVKRLKGLIDKK